MNTEGEQVKTMQCKFCVHRKDSPQCMYQEKGICKHFKKTETK